MWSRRVENLLVKRGNKAGSMHVTSYGDEGGEYEVKVDREPGCIASKGIVSHMSKGISSIRWSCTIMLFQGANA